MKQKFLKNSLLLFLFGIIMVSCELQEEAIHQHEHNSNLKLYEMKFEELMTNKRFINSFSKLPKSKKNLTTATVGRTVMENEYGFTIANKPAKVIEDNGETSYTFLITRDSTDANSFENLVIQTDSTNTTKAVIIKYNLTSPITSSADDSYSFTYNREITPIVYNNTTVSETSKMVIVCYWVYSLVCNNTRTGEIGPEHIAGPNCGRTYYNWTEECFSFDDGISNGGGSGPTGSGPTGGSTNTGSNVGSGGTGGANSINTSPVNNCITGNCIDENTTDPCEKIKKLQDDTNFKGKMANLIDAARNWSFERCYVMYNATTPTTTNNYTYQTFDGTANTPESGYNGNTTMQGIIHSHYDSLLSIFSAGDLQDLYFKLKNYPEITDDFFMGVVTSSNTAYLLQVPDRAAFIAFGDNYLADDEKFKKFMIKTMGDKYSINPNNSNEVNELGFLKMMADLNMGASLASVDFNATTPATGAVFNTWTKKVYNKRTRTVNPSNCD